MVTVGKVWRATCEVCGAHVEDNENMVALFTWLCRWGWLLQYQKTGGARCYSWAVYCPRHTASAPMRSLPANMFCGVSRMRHSVKHYCVQYYHPEVSDEYIATRIR